jgi:hypothetical protein
MCLVAKLFFQSQSNSDGIKSSSKSTEKTEGRTRAEEYTRK